MKLPWDDIDALTKYLKKHTLSEITIEMKGCKISLKKESEIKTSIPSFNVSEQPKTVEKKKEDKPGLYEVKAPMVGTFYSSSAPGSDPFVSVDSKIKKGDVLCIVEAMKIMNELPSEVSGTVKEVLVNNGDVVEYGQVIMRVDINP